MQPTIEKTILYSGLLYGSIYLFATSLREINKFLTSEHKITKRYVVVNGSIMLFTFITFSYISIKLLDP